MHWQLLAVASMHVFTAWLTTWPIAKFVHGQAMTAKSSDTTGWLHMVWPPLGPCYSLLVYA